MNNICSIRPMVMTVVMLPIIISCIAIVATSQQQPIPVQLEPLQLRQPFTIGYLANVQSNNNEHMVSENRRLTLSYDGSNLLYINENVDTHVTHICLYHDNETYIMDSNSNIAEIDPGFDFARLLYCPMPGVGIPKMPFFTYGLPAKVQPKFVQMAAPNVNSEQLYIDKGLYRVLGQNRYYGFFMYADNDTRNRSAMNGIGSVVTVASSGLTKVLWYDTFDVIGKPYLGHIWEFFNHARFQNIWLAKKIKMRWYNYAEPTPVTLQSVMYTLDNATSKALESSAYDPVTYLSKHGNITDFTGTSVRTFLYEPGNGPLETQRGKGMEIRKATTLIAKGSSNTGVIGLCIIFACASIWYVWLRRRNL